jgi:hypothetical protein
MNIETDFINDPFYVIRFQLENDYVLVLKWNIFNDKKDNNNLVLRVRYILEKDNERISLKCLGLNYVNFRQIYVSDEIKDEICLSLKDNNVSDLLQQNDVSLLIDKYFGDWIKTDFSTMINNGNSKILYDIF